MLRISCLRPFVAVLVVGVFVVSCGGQTVTAGRGDAAVTDVPDGALVDRPADVSADDPWPADIAADDPWPADVDGIDALDPLDAVEDRPPAPDAPRMDVAPRDVAGLLGVRCGVPAPEGAPHALPAPRYSGGTCPRLVPEFCCLLSVPFSMGVDGDEIPGEVVADA